MNFEEVNMPSKMQGDKVMYGCALCKRQFQFGPHIYEGRHIKEWNVEICDNCIKSNWDGVMIDRHPSLRQHLEKNGAEIKLNSRGWLNIPN